jgi:hypothetical protein
MKKLIFILSVIFCISCDEVLVPPEMPQTKASMSEPSTTYQISDNLQFHPPVEFIDGSLWEVVVFYYIGNDMVGIDSISPVLTGNISAKIKVPSTYEKIKYSFQLAPKKSQYYFGCANCRRYSENFIFLVKGENNIIEIHDLSSVDLNL